MRVTTATPEVARERSNERALAEARCPHSVPCNVQYYFAVGRLPARITGGAGGLRVAMALTAVDDRYGWGLMRVQPMRS